MNGTLSKNAIFINNWKLALLILMLAAGLRFWGVFELNEYIEDEILHEPTAISVFTYGTTTNWGWHHPQLSSLIMYGTIQMFGDNPVGWRSSNVFFGTATVALVFLVARLLYPGSAVPVISMALLALDPEHIFLSRTTFVEIPVTFFFLLYLYLMLEYTENKRTTLPFAGIAMGLTIATKAYYVFAIPLVVLYAAYRISQRAELTRSVIIDLLVSLLLLPISVYLLSYYWWFGRGFTPVEFIQMKMDAVWSLQHNLHFAYQSYVEAGGRPWEWFIKPFFWGHQRLLNSEEGIFLLQSNNPPFRLLVLPALVASAGYAWKKSLTRELLAPMLFICCYLLIISPRRPIFSYASTVLIPFAYYVVARAVCLVAVMADREKLVYTCFLFAVFVWGAYMFPIIAAQLVPVAPFRPILSMVRYLVNF